MPSFQSSSDAAAGNPFSGSGAATGNSYSPTLISNGLNIGTTGMLVLAGVLGIGVLYLIFKK